jgi:hypothetical protein
MAGRLKTFWYVGTGRWPERPPGGWTVAEIQARGREHGMVILAGCQPDELLDLVLKRSWWRTWIWPDFSVLFGPRPGARFGAAAAGSAVGGPLGAGIGALVGGWRSDREVEARERAAVPEGKIVMRDLATPFQTLVARVYLLIFFGIALFFAALLLAVTLMAIDPGMLDRTIAFFAGASSVPRSLHQISVDLVYSVLTFYVLCMVIIFINNLIINFISVLYHSHLVKDIKAGGAFLSLFGGLIVSFATIFYFFWLIERNFTFLVWRDYLTVLLFPFMVFLVIVSPIFVFREFYLMFCIRRSGKLPTWLRPET